MNLLFFPFSTVPNSSFYRQSKWIVSANGTRLLGAVLSSPCLEWRHMSTVPILSFHFKLRAYRSLLFHWRHTTRTREEKETFWSIHLLCRETLSNQLAMDLERDSARLDVVEVPYCPTNRSRISKKHISDDLPWTCARRIMSMYNLRDLAEAWEVEVGMN